VHALVISEEKELAPVLILPINHCT